ncbi:hypothetical protein B0T22DRAFT_415496 [Podospora appendiculata]|uniref:BTB domain-containing protein n=1 Tax=Podospora appendiculata TaxID=314037 RepID=A0AAE0WYQ3_9PEZI|nr:hypothetical protein B0T22DRAFT_415496 [Podospora appendiculata]
MWSSYPYNSDGNGVKAKDRPSAELMNSLHELFENGLYSDLTIKCGQDEYKVHKAIVSTRSPFFKACDNDFFVEGKTGVVELREVDPVAEKLMVHYFYHLDYPRQAKPVDSDVEDTSPKPLAPLPDTTSTATQHGGDLALLPIAARSPKEKTKMNGIKPKPAGPPPCTNLAIHARLYEIGERYGIRGLKDLALEKFKSDLKSLWEPGDLMEAIEVTYSPDLGNDNDNAMRKVIVQALSAHRDLLTEAPVQEVVQKFGKLSFDLMMTFHKGG